MKVHDKKTVKAQNVNLKDLLVELIELYDYFDTGDAMIRIKTPLVIDGHREATKEEIIDSAREDIFDSESDYYDYE